MTVDKINNSHIIEDSLEISIGGYWAETWDFFNFSRANQSLSGATLTWRISRPNGTLVLQVLGADDDDGKIEVLDRDTNEALETGSRARVHLFAAETALFSPGVYHHQITAVLADGEIIRSPVQYVTAVAGV